MPLLCNYYLTYRCNATCAFCHFGDHEAFRATRQAATTDVLTNLKAMKKLGVRFIDFTGGEPLLHRDVARFAQSATALGLKASITTNCLLYPKFAEQLRGNVYLLHFSLDSPIAAEHDASRGVPCFAHVMNSIDIAKDLGEHPDILFTVTDENVHHLPAMYDLARGKGLLLMLNPIFEYFRKESMNEATLAELERFGKKPMVYLNPSFIALRRQGGNKPDKPLCKAVSRVLVISPENEILLPCYHFHNEKIPIGADLALALQSPVRERHARMEGTHSFCEGCAINCYFEPSFAFPVNRLSLATIPSKLRYGFHKIVRERFLPES